MIYLSGVLEVELSDGKHVLVVAAWLQREDGRETLMFLGFNPETHKPRIFSLRLVEKINSVLVR